jgi:hypothetical protein
MTCPKGHKADIEREGPLRHIWCAICGWRKTVKIVKNHRKRWTERRRQGRKPKDYATLDALRAKHRGGGDEFI